MLYKSKDMSKSTNIFHNKANKLIEAKFSWKTTLKTLQMSHFLFWETICKCLDLSRRLHSPFANIHKVVLLLEMCGNVLPTQYIWHTACRFHCQCLW